MLTQELRRPGGTRELRPIQAAALLEARTVGGFFGPIGVGAGKTDISLLLPTVMASKVAVLMVPPALRAKLLEHEYPHLSTQYRLPNLASSTVFYRDVDCLLYVISYSQLSSVKGADLLDRIRPDLIVLDEAHSLKDPGASRTKRFLRYMRANPQTRLCVLSGSITSKSIKDFAHLARFSLRDGAPVPLHWPTLEEWAAALDPSDFPAPPGELLRFGFDDPREGFRQRMVTSPGVVATSRNHIGTSLVLTERALSVSPPVQKALMTMRETWTTPGGEEITDALSFSRYARQLAAGLYLRWVWPRQEPLELRREWLEARKEWHREIRQMLKGEAKKGLDSPLLLARAAAAGRWGSQTWGRWAEVKESAKPESEAVWIDDFMARDAAEWGRKHTGIVWYEHDALGQKIAELGGFPFYGGGMAASAEILNERGDRTIVASVRAHGEGKNLQAFSTQLVTTPSSNGKVWEQLLGRTHRSGQTADEVEVAIYLHTPEMRQAVKDAVEDAAYIEGLTGAHQKLRYCTTTFAL